MSSSLPDSAPLSPRWRQAVILVMIFGFSLLIWVTAKTYSGAPPIPAQVVGTTGQVLFAGGDIQDGQEVFLKYGLMEHGTLWGHGAYLGPDYTAEYLHRLAEIGRDPLAQGRYGRPFHDLSEGQALEIGARLKSQLKQNRFDPDTDTLRFSEAEEASYRLQREEWRNYFAGEKAAVGLPRKFIQDDRELEHLADYFAWATWATVAPRPGKDYSYTNNWPYEPLVGNIPTASTYLWSALSLITLLGGLGLILFVFGKFDYLGWGGAEGWKHAEEGRLQAWTLTPSQKAVGLYFAVVALLFLGQAALGGVLAHYRVEPGGFYGFDLARLLPYNLARTWHLQLAIFWIATAWVGGGLFLVGGVN